MQRRWKKTLKLRFLSQKLHEYKFVFLLCLSKLKFMCSWAFSDVLPPPFSIFISKLHEYRFVFLLRFPFPSSSMFSFFTSICICMRFFISVFCFFTACSLFLLKLRFLSQKASTFISKLDVQRFVFLLSLSKLKFFCVPELSLSWFPRHFRFLSKKASIFALIYYIILQLLLLIYSSTLTFLYTNSTFAILFFFVLDCSWISRKRTPFIGIRWT